MRGELLLVDNDVTIGELVAFVLRRAGFGVRTATSFSAARAALATASCDLVLSDVDLGVESALVELPRLAEEGLLPPTLVVSGYLDPEKRAWLGTLPQVVGFLDKPFDPLDLEREVAAALGEAQRRHATGHGMAPPVPGSDVEDEDGWVEIGGGA